VDVYYNRFICIINGTVIFIIYSELLVLGNCLFLVFVITNMMIIWKQVGETITTIPFVVGIMGIAPFGFTRFGFDINH
jgi:hypothetical protein